MRRPVRMPLDSSWKHDDDRVRRPEHRPSDQPGAQHDRSTSERPATPEQRRGGVGHLVARRLAADRPDRLEAEHRADRHHEEEQQLVQRQPAGQHDAGGLRRVERPVPGGDRRQIPEHEDDQHRQQREQQPPPPPQHVDPQHRLQPQRGRPGSRRAPTRYVRCRIGLRSRAPARAA